MACGVQVKAAGETLRLTEMILEELTSEAELTRKALECVPKGSGDWKPHPKSMTMGQLSQLVASMPSWISMMVSQDDLDVKQAGNGKVSVMESAELVKALEKAVESARNTLSATTDQHLETSWKLLEGGKVVKEDTRSSFVKGLFKHLAHHRGQLTVYLRMNDAKVPAIYGPSADEHRF